MKNRPGFTLIEILVTMVIMAFIMIPVGLIVNEHARSVVRGNMLTTALELAQRELGIVNNMAYSSIPLTDTYQNSYAGYPFDLRRTVTYVSGSNNYLKSVRVRVYPRGSTTDQLTDAVTYVRDVSYGSGAGGGAEGDEVDSFSSSGGRANRSNVNNITTSNTRATGNITMTGITITSSVGMTLTQVTLGGSRRYTGTLSLPAGVARTVPFQYNFFMNSGTSYTGGTLTHSNQNRYTWTVRYLFYDGTQSGTYTYAR